METLSAASPPLGVLLADSNRTQRELLVSGLRRRTDLHLITCELTTDEILEAASPAALDVAVLNVTHPRSGWPDLTIVRRLHLARPDMAKILLLDFYDRDLVVNAFRSGALGLFCLAESPFRMLGKCIHSVHRGEIWANNQQIRFLLETVSQVPSLRMIDAQGTRLLTPREEQVVALVADGLSNREVAAELKLSEHTVKKYLFRIFDKLGISSRVELVLYAVNHGGPRQAEWMAGGAA
ncbi:MAG TPA: response regulator transcription factor [Terriglobales bacterium]|nr:response regulator transcription factor [Terriglobales bacterium]